MASESGGDGTGAAYPWDSFTPTVGATTTAPTLGITVVHRFSFQTVGKTLHYSYYLKTSSAGTAGTGVYTIPLPPGVSIDPAYLTYAVVLPQNFDPNGSSIGAGFCCASGTTDAACIVMAFDATNLVFCAEISGQFRYIGSTAFTLGGAISFSFSGSVPILEMSAG